MNLDSLRSLLAEIDVTLFIWHDPEKSIRQVLTSELNERIETLLRIPAPTAAAA